MYRWCLFSFTVNRISYYKVLSPLSITLRMCSRKNGYRIHSKLGVCDVPIAVILWEWTLSVSILLGYKFNIHNFVAFTCTSWQTKGSILNTNHTPVDWHNYGDPQIYPILHHILLWVCPQWVSMKWSGCFYLMFLVPQKKNIILWFVFTFIKWEQPLGLSP